MAFLRTLFWIAVTVVVVVFCFHNWVPVSVNLFGGLKADVKLPVLLLIAFLIGFGPLFVWHKALRWRDRHRLAAPPPPQIPTETTLPDAAFPMAEPGTLPARAD